MIEFRYSGEELWNKDRVHVRDMISVGLVDESWLAKYPEPIWSRLKELLDDPNG